MSIAIFLARRDGGYRAEMYQDHTLAVDGHANLIVEGKHGDETTLTLSEGDWERLRDRIDQLMNQKGWT